MEIHAVASVCSVMHKKQNFPLLALKMSLALDADQMSRRLTS